MKERYCNVITDTMFEVRSGKIFWDRVLTQSPFPCLKSVCVFCSLGISFILLSSRIPSPDNRASLLELADEPLLPLCNRFDHIFGSWVLGKHAVPEHFRWPCCSRGGGGSVEYGGTPWSAPECSNVSLEDVKVLEGSFEWPKMYAGMKRTHAGAFGLFVGVVSVAKAAVPGQAARWPSRRR